MLQTLSRIRPGDRQNVIGWEALQQLSPRGGGLLPCRAQQPGPVEFPTANGSADAAATQGKTVK